MKGQIRHYCINAMINYASNYSNVHVSTFRRDIISIKLKHIATSGDITTVIIYGTRIYWLCFYNSSSFYKNTQSQNTAVWISITMWFSNLIYSSLLKDGSIKLYNTITVHLRPSTGENITDDYITNTRKYNASDFHYAIKLFI